MKLNEHWVESWVLNTVPIDNELLWAFCFTSLGSVSSLISKEGGVSNPKGPPPHPTTDLFKY